MKNFSSRFRKKFLSDYKNSKAFRNILVENCADFFYSFDETYVPILPKNRPMSFKMVLKTVECYAIALQSSVLNRNPNLETPKLSKRILA